MMTNLMTILERKAFISSNPRIVLSSCPPPCGHFSIQESASGGLSYKVKKEVSVLDTPSSVSVHECSANPDILNHDARLNDVSPNDASPNDVSCPSCSPHRTGYSSVTPETNLFPGSHGLLSVHFPPARMPIPLKHPNRNCFPLQHFFHTQRKPILLYRQVRKLLPSSFLHLLSWYIVFA